MPLLEPVGACQSLNPNSLHSYLEASNRESNHFLKRAQTVAIRKEQFGHKPERVRVNGAHKKHSLLEPARPISSSVGVAEYKSESAVNEQGYSGAKVEATVCDPDFDGILPFSSSSQTKDAYEDTIDPALTTPIQFTRQQVNGDTTTSSMFSDETSSTSALLHQQVAATSPGRDRIDVEGSPGMNGDWKDVVPLPGMMSTARPTPFDGSPKSSDNLVDTSESPRYRISDKIKGGSRSKIMGSRSKVMTGSKSTLLSAVTTTMFSSNGQSRNLTLNSLSEVLGEDASRLHCIVASPWFNLGAVFVVFLHSIFLAIDTNYDLGDGITSVSFLVDATFTIIYIIELILRAITYKRYFFRNTWNTVDLILVSLSVLDMILVVAADISEPSLYTLTSLRLLRLMRMARLLRLFRFFKSLWLLVCGLAASMRLVFWAWVFISLIIYIFGLCFTRILAPYTCTLSDDSDADLETLDEYFGSVPRCMFSIFQVVTLEDWIVLADASAKYEPWTRILFFMILGSCTWGVMHVITAVFVESALEASSVRTMDMAKKKKEEYESACKNLCEVFARADVNGDGFITKKEFLNILTAPDMHKKLVNVGIDRKSAAELFDILDLKGVGMLNSTEFVEGVVRSCGLAQNKDIISMRCDVWRVELRLQEELDNACNFIHNRMEQSANKVEALQKLASPVLRRATASLKKQQLRGSASSFAASRISTDPLSLKQGLGTSSSLEIVAPEPVSPRSPSDSCGEREHSLVVLPPFTDAPQMYWHDGVEEFQKPHASTSLQNDAVQEFEESPISTIRLKPLELPAEFFSE